ncbi:MAG TPA: ring-cleaving dioxygenase [Phototrophicaceae bacterium]|nr:ring-cleaving dioxygenase [Phototrophicaceae bacterium]
MQLHGLHHVTAVTSQAAYNVFFYTQTLGLRLVKKTVNQDDISAYHLFFADRLGTPGTDITFFDWPNIGLSQSGQDSISQTMFRVNGRDALDYWAARFDERGVKHQPITSFAGRDSLAFEDEEGQRLLLVDDQGAPFEGEVWEGAGIPAAYALRGFYGVQLAVPAFSEIDPILTTILGWEITQRLTNPQGEAVRVYGMDGGGPGKEVWVVEQPRQRQARLGAGGVHHVAFRVRDDEEQQYWRQRLVSARVPVSQFIDRFYFHSIYFRISNGILFEIATDGPGFAADESLETLGEKLALPPFLEPQRAAIEAGLKPIEVVRE